MGLSRSGKKTNMSQFFNRVEILTDKDAIMKKRICDWEKLKQWIQTQEYDSRGKDYGTMSYIYTKVIRKMNELEQEGMFDEKSKI